MRKFLAIFLTVAMLASFAVVPAFAAADGRIYNVPGNYVTPTEYTNKLVHVNATGTTFELRAANGTTVLELGAEPAVTGFTIENASDDKSVTVKTNGAAAGTVAQVELTATDGTTAVFFVQAGSAATDAPLTAISIKQPASNVVVAGGDIKLEIEKTPKDHAESIYWFSSDSVALGVDTTAANSKTLTAGAVTSTTAVTVKAISLSGKQAEITVFVVPGQAATGVAFAKTFYEFKANVDATMVAETVVTPSNGITTGRTVAVTGTAFTKTTAGGVDTWTHSDGKLAFTLDNLGEIKVTKADADGAYPYAVVLEVAIGSLKGQTVVSFTKPDAAAAGRKIQMEGVPTSGKLVKGQEFQYKASVYDMDPAYKAAKVVKDAKIEWYSTNPAVATVDKATGVVKAVAEGTVDIIAVSAGATAAAPATTTEVRATLTVVKEAAKGEVKFVKASTLNVRAFANSSAIKIGELKQGALVEVTEVTGAWAKINYNGGVAYVANEYLIAPVNYTVTSSKLAVRSFPGATAAVKELVYGDTVKAIGELASNKAWTIIVLDDTTVAYVASKYVTEGTQIGIVTSSTLTMRVSASTTAAAYANKLVKGQTVEIVGKEGAFLKVKTAEGFVGYAAAAYITIF